MSAHHRVKSPLTISEMRKHLSFRAEMAPDRYFFVIQGLEQSADEVVIAREEGAQEYARRVVTLLVEADGYDHHGLVVVVKNNAGKTVYSLAF